MGDTGCHFKSILSSAATRWQIVLHSDVLAHQQQECKRGIGKKLLLAFRAVVLDKRTDVVAGDFDGAAWRRQTNNGNLSFNEEAFAASDSPMPPGHRCGPRCSTR